MKSFILACIAAIAYGEPETTNGNKQSFAEVRDGADKSKGVVGEVLVTDGADQFIAIFMRWETQGEDYEDGSLIQNYAEWADFEGEGRKMGFTCNAKYDRDRDYADMDDSVWVVNTLGEKSLMNSANEEQNW